jgi:hypothetical protein
MIEQAKSFAARLHNDKSLSDDGARVRRAFELAYGRPADDAEVQASLQYLTAGDAPDEAEQIKLSRWERLTQALLSANEFMYLD